MPTTTLADYFLDRLAGLGVECLFGVPGDFNLPFLDSLIAHPTIKWIGCCNELNAAYAADGYARASGLPGVLLTTFGVGELSAINGIAGSYSERIPIVHLVGVPSTKLQSRSLMLHHTLGNGRFDEMTAMNAHVSVAQAILTSVEDNNGRTAAQEIDRVLKLCISRSRPVYITMPTDLIFAETSSEPLKEKMDLETIKHTVKNESQDHDQEFIHHVLGSIVDMYKKANNPSILVDVGTIRFDLRALVEQLVQASGLPFFTTPMGKGALDEDHPNFGGVYFGSVSEKHIQNRFESSDFVLIIGGLKTDFNTGSFSYRVPVDQTVELHSDHIKVQYASYPALSYHIILPLLIEALSKVEPKKRSEAINLNKRSKLVEGDHKEMVKQDAFWAAVSGAFQDGDIIMADAGTCSFGVIDAKLAKNAVLGSQVLWGSIGFAGGAVLGASFAAKQRGRRCILFTGEGAWQETIQDLSTIIRLGLTPILFVINNKGYTVERLIRGPTQPYNDVPVWEWQLALRFMGAKEGQYKSYSIETAGQLEELLADETFNAAKVIQLVEVHMDKLDAPRALRLQAALVAKANTNGA